MTMDLVTGMGPGPHIDSRAVGELNAGIIGTGDYVLDIADRLSCTMQSANKAVIGTGGAVMHGRHVTVTAPETVTVQSGTQGQKRNDLIVLRYTRDPATSIESASITCLKGTPTTGTPTDPTILTGDILDGARSHDMVLYRIPLDGIVVGAPVPLYKSLNTMDKIRDSVTQPVRTVKVRDLYGSISWVVRGGVCYATVDAYYTTQWVVDMGGNRALTMPGDLPSAAMTCYQAQMFDSHNDWQQKARTVVGADGVIVLTGLQRIVIDAGQHICLTLSYPIAP